MLPHPHIIVFEVATNTAAVLRGEGPASSVAVGVVAEEYALSRLAEMPAEIRRMVWSFTGDDLFWRLASAVDVALYLDAAPTGDFTSNPLRRVAL